jgi:tetratricopeptide (TPR) repeat protein
VGRARTFTDEAERRWRDGDLEGAHDACDRANEQYDAVLGLSPSAIEDRERIEAEANRVRQVTKGLESTPLQEAVDADRAASEAQEPEAVARKLETAIERYQHVLEVDDGAEQRRFAGDPEDIRDRLDEIVEEVTSTRRNAAKKAQQAGNWCMETEQYELAVEEFETARAQFERATAVAMDHYPEAIDHLESDRSAVEDQLDRAKAARDGETLDPIDGQTCDDEAATNDETPGTDIETRLGQVDGERFRDIVATVLGETGWTVVERGDQTVTVSKGAPTNERMLVRLFHRPEGGSVGREAIETCRDLLTGTDDIDAVMMATSGRISDEATRASRDQAVRLLDDECLATVIESRDLDGVPRKVELD